MKRSDINIKTIIYALRKNLVNYDVFAVLAKMALEAAYKKSFE